MQSEQSHNLEVELIRSATTVLAGAMSLQASMISLGGATGSGQLAEDSAARDANSFLREVYLEGIVRIQARQAAKTVPDLTAAADA